MDMTLKTQQDNDLSPGRQRNSSIRVRLLRATIFTYGVIGAAIVLGLLFLPEQWPSIRLAIAGAAVFLISAGVGVVYVWGRFTRLSRDLEQIAHTAQSVVDGETVGSLTIKANDEVGLIAAACDQFKTAVIEQRADLEKQLEEQGEELGRLQKDLTKASSLANIAEATSDVLHNVKNTLNSINVSSKLIKQITENSMSKGISKAVTLIEKNSDDLADFFASNPKSQELAAYLSLATRKLLEEQAKIVELSDKLNEKVDHVKIIVESQQNAAKMNKIISMSELCEAGELVDSAVVINQKWIDKYQIEVSIDYDGKVELTTDKQKILEILINVISNAAHALAGVDRDQRTIGIAVKVVDGHQVRFEITDNGVGIPQQNLERIFNHGFTTRADGNGFGLHSCYNAAQLLGGNITALSEGEGEGATFVLELPVTPSAQIPLDQTRPMQRTSNFS